MPLGPLDQMPALEALGRLHAASHLSSPYRRRQPGHDAQSDVVLDIEHVLVLPIEPFTPHVVAELGVGQLRRDTDP